ncbi:MAG: hypothetical protein QXT84_03635 [Candidatus Bathyarchaeia archaeon]
MKRFNKILGLIILVCPLLMGWQEEEPWTPSVSKAIWSPSGDKIAFVGNLNENEVSSLYIMNIDGTNLKKLVEGVFNLFCFSPDGSKIYYLVNTPEEISEPPYVVDHTYIYVINADGSNPHRLRNYPEEEMYFALSSDGSRAIIDGILCTSDGEELKLLPLLFGGSFSPDGKWLAGTYYEYWESKSWFTNQIENVWIMNIDTFERQPVTSGDFRDRNPCWSPADEWIVFETNRGADTGFPSRIWLVRPNGADLHPLFDYSQLPDTYDSYPTWSPDGNWIIFVRDTPEDSNIWVAKVDGTEVYKFTNFGYASLPQHNKPQVIVRHFERDEKPGTKRKVQSIKRGNKRISQIADALMENKSHISKHIFNSYPQTAQRENSSSSPQTPLVAGGLSLSALGYVIWKFLKLLT